MPQNKNRSEASAESGSLFIESLPSIAQFLSFGCVLRCRLTCMEALNQVHAALTVEDCAKHLSMLLQDRELVVLGNTRRWKEAGNDMFHVAHCLHQLGDMAATNPLDAVFRMLRIVSHIPIQLAVIYSGKYGKFCSPCDTNTGAPRLNAYPSCPKGKTNCETCAFKIPPRTLLDETEKKAQPQLSARQDLEDDDEDETPNGSLDIYSVLSIRTPHKNRARGVYSMDLDNFYCKCVPNLPNDLICPICRVGNRRTLLLSAFSYQSEPSAAREQPGHMSLSFTPLLEPERKRARRQAFVNDTAINIFPPKEYSSMFLPRYSGAALLRKMFRQDCKHAMSIHCTSCQKFGLISPARLCMPCHLRLDEAEKSVGGVVFRPDRNRQGSTCMHCRYCDLANNDSEGDPSVSREESDMGDQDDVHDDSVQEDHSANNRIYGDRTACGSNGGEYDGFDQESDVEHAYDNSGYGSGHSDNEDYY